MIKLYSYTLTYGDYLELPITMAVVGVGVLICIGNGRRLLNKVLTDILMVVSVFLLLFSIICLFTSIADYNELRNRLQNGEYEICIGKVENFSPAPPNGHGTESFTIGSINFEYSDYVSTYGYHTTYHNGGVIRENGQILKIHYIVDKESSQMYILEIFCLTEK